ncbi:MAG: glycosyltransferase [Maritimibacter sp.]|nr:glycosyltransferase [Maritimibacter sp.]
MRDAILIAAYDAGLHTSEGYVARSLLSHLDPRTRVILVTRRNNVAELSADPGFRAANPHVHLVGFDLPKWAAWWKRGARFYGLYAYLWQASWPLALRSRRWLVERLEVVHTLNFHNDSIPSLAWFLGRPTVWGPINHHEPAAPWRTTSWPRAQRWRQSARALLRGLLWRADPLLRLAVNRTDLILSAGRWVDRRLGLEGRHNIRRLSQLGIDPEIAALRSLRPSDTIRIVSAGRLDWLKSLDLILLALVHLPKDATVTLIGDGPCRDFLSALARDLGIAERVIFRPTVPRAQLLALYNDFDLFVFASPEVAGLSWIEALATGLPVVAFDGQTELADRADSLSGLHVVPAGDDREVNIRALADGILKVARSHPEPREIAASVKAHYSWPRFTAEIVDAYETVREPPR